MTVDLTLLFASRKNVRQRLSSAGYNKGRISVVHRVVAVFSIFLGILGGITRWESIAR